MSQESGLVVPPGTLAGGFRGCQTSPDSASPNLASVPEPETNSLSFGLQEVANEAPENPRAAIGLRAHPTRYLRFKAVRSCGLGLGWEFDIVVFEDKVRAWLPNPKHQSWTSGVGCRHPALGSGATA